MTDKMTAAEYKAIHSKKVAQKAQGTRMKYKNEKPIIDGITFDSKKEAKYYGLCKLRVACKQLIRFEHHVIYPLVVNGLKISSYEADFVLYHPNGTVSVIDVKGDYTATLPVFMIKKKLMVALHGIHIQIVN